MAMLMGCGRQTIRELCHTKEIPFIRVGRAFMFSKDAVRNWLNDASKNNWYARSENQ
jgi:excisionase family DNA binding protein